MTGINPAEQSPAAGATAVAVAVAPVFLGFALDRWLFAFRIWLSVVVALYVAFWLQLGSPSTAALTVAILAFPTRGQGLEKAAYRFIATIVGVIGAIVICGAFPQADSLMLLAFAIWVGLAVYATNLFDGNRAYATALCASTLGLIAVDQIDTPQNIFLAGMERGAAIAIGILSIAIVNDLLGAPNYHDAIALRLRELYRKVDDLTRRMAGGGAVENDETIQLIAAMTALRPETTALSTESSSGTARAAAARTALVELVTWLAMARTAFHSGASVAQPAVPLTAIQRRVTAHMAGLSEAIRPSRALRAPIYRSQRVAAESGARAAVYFIVAAAVFYYAGWPQANFALGLVAILLGLGATAPDPRGFTKLAMISAPIAGAIAGILEFVILDGADDFPTLVLALAPLAVGAGLMMKSPNRAIAALGRINFIFTMAVLSPSNPESYDPQSYLYTLVFACIAPLLLFAMQLVLPPIPTASIPRILIADAERELASAPARQRLEPEEAIFRDADRLAQIVTNAGDDEKGRQMIGEALSAFDRSSANQLSRGPLIGSACQKGMS